MPVDTIKRCWGTGKAHKNKKCSSKKYRVCRAKKDGKFIDHSSCGLKKKR